MRFIAPQTQKNYEQLGLCPDLTGGAYNTPYSLIISSSLSRPTLSIIMSSVLQVDEPHQYFVQV